MIYPETIFKIFEYVVSSLYATKCKAICPSKKVDSGQMLTDTELISVGCAHLGGNNRGSPSPCLKKVVCWCSCEWGMDAVWKMCAKNVPSS